MKLERRTNGPLADVPALPEKRRIAILLPDLRAGGAERVSISLAAGFAAAGFRPEFVLLAARGEHMGEVDGVYPFTVLPARRFRQVLPALVRYLRSDPPDAVIAQMWPLTLIAPFAAWLARYRGRVVSVDHGHTPAGFRQRLAAALICRLPVTVGSVSRGGALAFAKQALLPLGRVVTLSNPIVMPTMPDAQAAAAAEAEWRGTPRGGRILSVARLTGVKDQATLLRALARLPESCRLMIVGDGSEQAALRAEAKRLGIADRLILTGFRPDPAPYYMSADVFAISSLKEGFGNVIVEAMACGLPVVSTDCPFGPAEVLEGGRYGRLVPVGDDMALANGVLAALDMPGDPAERIARAAEYSVEAASSRYLRLLFADSGVEHGA